MPWFNWSAETFWYRSLDNCILPVLTVSFIGVTCFEVGSFTLLLCQPSSLLWPWLLLVTSRDLPVLPSCLNLVRALEKSSTVGRTIESTFSFPVGNPSVLIWWRGNNSLPKAPLASKPSRLPSVGPTCNGSKFLALWGSWQSSKGDARPSKFAFSYFTSPWASVVFSAFFTTPVSANMAALGEAELEEADEKEESDDGELSPELSPSSLGVVRPEFSDGVSDWKSGSIEMCFTSDECVATVELCWRLSRLVFESLSYGFVSKRELLKNSFT